MGEFVTNAVVQIQNGRLFPLRQPLPGVDKGVSRAPRVTTVLIYSCGRHVVRASSRCEHKLRPHHIPQHRQFTTQVGIIVCLRENDWKLGLGLLKGSGVVWCDVITLKRAHVSWLPTLRGYNTLVGCRGADLFVLK